MIHFSVEEIYTIKGRGEKRRVKKNPP